jgi:enoyl-ACP reductase-like protein
MSSVTSDLTGVVANGLYAATQGGVDALTKTAAIEVTKDNISVNLLAFVGIDIPDDMFARFIEDQGITLEQILTRFPMGRMGTQPELVAAGALPVLRRRPLRHRYPCWFSTAGTRPHSPAATARPLHGSLGPHPARAPRPAPLREGPTAEPPAPPPHSRYQQESAT